MPSPNQPPWQPLCCVAPPDEIINASLRNRWTELNIASRLSVYTSYALLDSINVQFPKRTACYLNLSSHILRYVQVAVACTLMVFRGFMLDRRVVVVLPPCYKICGLASNDRTSLCGGTRRRHFAT
jgi:hypothetical protein